ncbi:hypothetical protein CC1G_06885 [Coprinopsis cinerea okayama7|uniref:SnoaL-like domain-containing protein n=1 Tax=Coprinopsis cinerea (strain Okayama-7 / 130 / ATCC MYA-4618 / FGSC 9003) TaxID=240176 RepID=A8N713_COPC7|nr:hypothetical protein CC1G_06885 [Coprinopsis cinerea okayama7\|eukprot:XP_001830619.1 hypothetical protein CC1G_06885 [Coprinopsis cinerea okayama7\
MRFFIHLLLASLLNIVFAAPKSENTDAFGLLRRTPDEARRGRPKCLSPSRVKAGEDWAIENYRASDDKDPSYVDNFIGEDTQIFFGESPPSSGKESIRESIEWQWNATSSVSHVLQRIIVLEDLTSVQTEVTYTFTDGAALTRKAITLYEKTPEDQFPAAIRVFGDFVEVFAKFIEVAGPPPGS